MAPLEVRGRVDEGEQSSGAAAAEAGRTATRVLATNPANISQGTTVRDTQAHLAREFYATVTEWKA